MKRSVSLFVIFGLIASIVTGQSLLNSSGQNSTGLLYSTDRAVLEAGDPRSDLPCTVVHDKAVLGFDLKFHGRFDVAVPLKELTGSENLLTILFRVTPEEKPDEPSYFVQRVQVPDIAEDAKGEVYIQGSFDMGEGKYHVDWLMRDRAERVCSDYWDVEASLSKRERDVALMIPPATVTATEIEQFRDEPPIQRNPDAGLNVKMVVNFAPQNARSAALQPMDLSALVSILRTISRDPRIGKFSIVAFNMQEQKVLYRKEMAERIDFPAIGKAVTEIKLGTVDLGRLGEKNSDTRFLANLIRSELQTGEAPPDAVIFAGPKAMLNQNIAQDDLREVGSLNFPVFYMNYNLSPHVVPWRDAISHAVKHFRGIEYTISQPRDLWYAVSEMVSHVTKTRVAQRTQPQETQ